MYAESVRDPLGTIFDRFAAADGNRDEQMVLNDMAHRAASENVHIDLLGS